MSAPHQSDRPDTPDVPGVLVTVPAPSDIVVAWPEAPQLLFLLFHAAGEQPASLLPLAQRLAAQFPQGVVACVAAPHAWDEGAGFQWYSLRGLTAGNLRERTQPALAEFAATVRAWQQQCGLGPERTAIVAHGQSAILGLEALAQLPPFCARLFAIGGHFVTLPAHLHDQTSLHWLHGRLDATVPYQAAIEAAAHLKALDADFSVDVFADTAAGLTDEMGDRIVHLLQNHVPQRMWREAMASAGAAAAATDEDGEASSSHPPAPGPTLH